MMPVIRRLTLLAMCALALAAAGCAVNPATGKKEFTLVTPAQEAAPSSADRRRNSLRCMG